MVDLIKRFFNSNTDGKLARLISAWTDAEDKLNAGLKRMNAYVESNDHSNLELDDEYRRLKKSTDIADKIWSQCYLDVLAYNPENIQEIGQKILVSLNSISEGLGDPRLYKSIEKCALKLIELDPAVTVENSNDNSLKEKAESCRLLIIDDSALDRMLIKHAFLSQNDKLDLVEIESGNEVVQEIKLKRPAATLLDLNMPRISGLEILQMIRRDVELKSHPVWIISGSSEETDKNLSLSSGADGYYAKPDSLAAYNTIAADILQHVSA